MADMSALELRQYKLKNLEIDNFFDCLSDVLTKVTGGNLYKSPSFDKHFSQYMLCRYLSMSKSLLPYGEYLNSVQTILDKKRFYLLAYTLIPQQRSSFIRYLKKPKKEVNLLHPEEPELEYQDLFNL